MTDSDGLPVDDDTPEADVAEQLIPVDVGDEGDTWVEAAS